jgi:hypothetical protein
MVFPPFRSNHLLLSNISPLSLRPEPLGFEIEKVLVSLLMHFTTANSVDSSIHTDENEIQPHHCFISAAVTTFVISSHLPPGKESSSDISSLFERDPEIVV